MHICRMYGKVARSKWAYPKDQLAALPEMFVEESLQQLDAHVGQLCDALKPDSMLFVCAGPGDTTHQRRKEVTVVLGLLVCPLTVLCIRAARPGFLACIIISLDHQYVSLHMHLRRGCAYPVQYSCIVMSIHLTAAYTDTPHLREKASQNLCVGVSKSMCSSSCSHETCLASDICFTIYTRMPALKRLCVAAMAPQ